jgi:divalent metal cation (Fe/Co/Zn/Cd) transporter
VGAAFTLARQTGDLLVGESIGPEATARLRQIFADDPDVIDVARVLTMQLGPDEVLLTASVRFRRCTSIDEVETAIARLEKTVAAVYPAIRHIYFESGALRSALGESGVKDAPAG